MKALFEVKDVDRVFYEERLRGFLPDRIVDIHTHVWRRSDRAMTKRKIEWPALLAKENPIEDLLQTYTLLFPGKTVTPMIFSSAGRDDDLDRLNAYIEQSARAHDCPALLYADPAWSGAELEKRIREGGYLGVKVYLSLAPAHIPEQEIRIFDFLPHHQLEVLHREGWIVMLHIPRPLRLRDPVNLRQMVEIEGRYSKVKLIIAHVGRAYCDEDVGDAFDVLRDTRTMLFDISANCNQRVFEQLIEAVGPSRILFGSDLPIPRMRTRRICEDGVYVNLVPHGLYGDVSGMAHMRAVSGAEAEKLTFFLYEQIDAFRMAAANTGLTSSDIEAIFRGNAEGLMAQMRAPRRKQLQMVWPPGRRKPRPPRVPDGYVLRTYEPGDEDGWIRLVRDVGLGKNWTRETAVRILKTVLPAGLFFVTHKTTGVILATCAALHRPIGGHPFGAEVAWVAVDEAHRGKRLGRTVTSTAIRRCLAAGYTDIFLLTDDERSAAIKTYLNLGLTPVLSEPGMEERWRNVRAKLGT